MRQGCGGAEETGDGAVSTQVNRARKVGSAAFWICAVSREA